MNSIELTIEQDQEHKEMSVIEKITLPKLVLFGDELIELDESMFTSGLCPECRKLGYCKRGNNDFKE